jgi:protein-L-isoaspartate(D-aspartate) O-methyltransferase
LNQHADEKVNQSHLSLYNMRSTEDTYRHQALRKKLVQGIHAKGITDEKVLAVMLDIPRHFFLDSAFDEAAYAVKAFPIGEGQTISQPYTVAYQTQLLEVKPFEKVLEIGTGSAYQACVLAEMGAQVFTIERQRKLYDANKNFSFLKKYPTIKFFYGDGYEGLPTFAPFDKILITAAAPEIPQKLIEQLKPGGMMVLPLGTGDVQRMMRLTKLPSGALKEEVFDRFSFVPMIEGKK